MNACLYSCVCKTYLQSKKMYSDIYRLKRTYLQLRFLQDLAFGRQSCLQWVIYIYCLVSRKILEKINVKIGSLTSLNQWKNTSSVINWFNNIPNKASSVFIVFDIESFFPSISEELLKMSINYAKQFFNIPERDIDIIMHSRKSLLFHQDAAWVKKGDSGLFDVIVGSYDGAEVCQLVGLYILNRLSKKYDKKSTGLYRDNDLAVFSNISGPQADRIKKTSKEFSSSSA